MPPPLPFRCKCGSIRGRIAERDDDRVKRLTCYCDDCQAFAALLGYGEMILDARGGTDIVQLSPACISIDRGIEHLACLRHKPRGLLRWHARCCGMPVANTMANRHIPFVGMITQTIDCEAVGGSLDALLGPPQMGVFGRFVRGNKSGLNAHRGVPIGMLAEGLWTILRRRLRGDHTSSPFFDARTGEPIASPRVISLGQMPDCVS